MSSEMGLPREWAKPAAAPAKAGRTAHGKGGLIREGIFSRKLVCTSDIEQNCPQSVVMHASYA
jgi:hypothetical protein